MTPNPNPSPEDEKLAEDAYSDGYEFFRNKWIGDHVEMNADLVRHFVPRALSPQTLPAPGEVERLRDLYAVHEAWPVDKHPRNGAPTEEWEPYFAANRARKELLDAIPALLATVAAANDEGVADTLETVLSLLTPPGNTWRGDEPAWQTEAYTLVRAAIRLLSQGEPS